jgi:hypothetical protein
MLCVNVVAECDKYVRETWEMWRVYGEGGGSGRGPRSGGGVGVGLAGWQVRHHPPTPGCWCPVSVCALLAWVHIDYPTCWVFVGTGMGCSGWQGSVLAVLSALFWVQVPTWCMSRVHWSCCGL